MSPILVATALIVFSNIILSSRLVTAISYGIVRVRGGYVPQSEPRWRRVWNLWGVRVSETTIQRIDRVMGLPTRHRPVRVRVILI